MTNELKQIENDIKKVIASGLGEKYQIVLKLSNIKEIPIDSFEKLQELLSNGKAIMRQYPLSTGSGTFNLVATNLERKLFSLFGSLVFIIPIVGIVLSFIYSWWFLLFIVSPFLTTRINKRIYLYSIFNRAANSEIAFCYLFSAHCITIELLGYGLITRNTQT